MCLCVKFWISVMIKTRQIIFVCTSSGIPFTLFGHLPVYCSGILSLYFTCRIRQNHTLSYNDFYFFRSIFHMYHRPKSHALFYCFYLLDQSFTCSMNQNHILCSCCNQLFPDRRRTFSSSRDSACCSSRDSCSVSNPNNSNNDQKIHCKYERFSISFSLKVWFVTRNSPIQFRQESKLSRIWTVFLLKI